MAANKFLQLDPTTGRTFSITPVTVTTGTAQAGQIPALASTGQFDPSLIPSSASQSVVQATATAAITAGQFVNLYLSGGVLSVRPADNTNAASQADGYVTAAIANAAVGSVTLTGGMVSGLSGLTIGAVYFMGTAGAATTTPPSATGTFVQYIGKALSTSVIEFNFNPPIYQ